jgi:alpha-galactosidase
MTQEFELVAEIEVGPGAQVLECGWQSWSPSGWYPAHAHGPRPLSPQGQVMGYRHSSPRWKGAFQSEGLMAVNLGKQSFTVTSDTLEEPACIRAWLNSGRLRVAADQSVCTGTRSVPGQVALAQWAAAVAAKSESPRLRPIPAGWCSWYFYGRAVTATDVKREMDLADRLGLPIEISLLDAGYEQALGDWLTPREDFGNLAELAKALRGMGKIPGIWVAPFIAATHSDVARKHPDWWLNGVSAGHLWSTDLLALDAATDEAVDWLASTFSELVAMGFGFFKLDFLYAGTLVGGGGSWRSRENVAGYRHVLRRIRDAVGPTPFLAGCGAPLLPSVGLFDSMRVSSDVGTNWLPRPGDTDGVPNELWYPSGSVAIRSCAARAFAHGNWWVNDPDCIIVRPQMEGRDRWAELVSALPGLSMSGDSLGELDERGLELTRQLLRSAETNPLTPAQLTNLDDLGLRAQNTQHTSSAADPWFQR